MKTDRRNFLKSIAYSLGGAGLLFGLNRKYQFANWTQNSASNIPEKDFWLWSNIGSPRGYSEAEIQKHLESQNKDINAIIGFNPKSGQKKIIPISFFGHHLAHDKNSHMAATCEKWSTTLALIDLKKGILISEIKAPPYLRFFGHIQFSEDSNEIYASAVDDNKNEGVILVFSPKDLEFIRSFKSHGEFPHQILLFNPDELMVAHAKSKSITVLNPKTGELIKTFNLASPAPAHFVFERSLDTFIVGGRNFPVAPKNFSEDQKKKFDEQFTKILSVLEFHDAYKGENGNLMTLPHSEILSLEKTHYNGSWMSIVTLPDANKIYLFDLHKRTIIAELTTAFSPRGLAISPHTPDIFYVNSNKKELFKGQIIGQNNIELKVEKISDFGNGQHLSLTQS